MWVKICGNTNLEDALLAANLGANALGFVFAPSARQVRPTDVRAMTAKLPPTVERVGVFPDWSAEHIEAAVREARLTAVQLHGSFDLERANALCLLLGEEIKIIQVLHWAVEKNASSAARVNGQLSRALETPAITRVLVDSQFGPSIGGTGVPFSWDAARNAFRKHPETILAGGLTPDNVASAMELLQPWGVDVVSGVEASPGRKDTAKLARFLAQARRAPDSPPA